MVLAADKPSETPCQNQFPPPSTSFISIAETSENPFISYSLLFQSADSSPPDFRPVVNVVSNNGEQQNRQEKHAIGIPKNWRVATFLKTRENLGTFREFLASFFTPLPLDKIATIFIFHPTRSMML
jgi:hypothetical protein